MRNDGKCSLGNPWLKLIDPWGIVGRFSCVSCHHAEHSVYCFHSNSLRYFFAPQTPHCPAGSAGLLTLKSVRRAKRRGGTAADALTVAWRAILHTEQTKRRPAETLGRGEHLNGCFHWHWNQTMPRTKAAFSCTFCMAEFKCHQSTKLLAERLTAK